MSDTDEDARKVLERAGFRVVSDDDEQNPVASDYPPGHCWHLVPRVTEEDEHS